MLGRATPLEILALSAGLICRLLPELEPPSVFQRFTLLSGVLVALTLHICSLPTPRIFLFLSEIVA